MPTAPVINTEQLVSTLARKMAVDVLGSVATFASCAMDSTTGKVTVGSGHGMVVGDQVTVTTVNTAGKGVTAGVTYYVVAQDSTTISIATTAGGTAIVPSAAITLGITELGWLRVRGMTELKPNLDSNLEDDSDYDSGGWGSKTKTGMSWSLEMTFARKVGITSAKPDPGQEVLRAAATAFGAAGTAQVRWYDRTGGVDAYSGYGTVAYAPQGGKYTDLDFAKVTVTGQGARTAITNPVAS